MKRHAFIGKIRAGCEQEYIRRHNEIWKELVEAYRQAGIRNLTCFLRGTELFGYFEMDEELSKQAVEQPIERKWQEYMAELADPDEDQSPPIEVFHMD